jgi:hypothetical protein
MSDTGREGTTIEELQLLVYELARALQITIDESQREFENALRRDNLLKRNVLNTIRAHNHHCWKSPAKSHLPGWAQRTARANATWAKRRP